MENPNKRKAIFWGLAVVYLLYTIYKLFRNYPSTKGNERIIVTVGMVVFLLAAAYILFQIIRVLKSSSKQDEEASFSEFPPEAKQDDNKNTEYTESHVDNDRNER